MSPDILAMIWKMSLQTAIVAAVVWVICRLAPKAPASWRFALWLLVIVKLFIPPFAYLPAQVAFWQRPGPAMMQPVAMPEPTSPVASMDPQVRHLVQVAPRPATEQPAASAPIDASQVLAFIWLGGVLAMTGLTVLRFSRQKILIGGSSRTSDELAAMLGECAQRLGVRGLPRIRLSPDAQTPMLVGAIHPVILLPEETLNSCGESNLRAMLLHELAHVKRRDMAVLWLQQLAQALFFFHPAVWLAGWEMRRERELACDELVLSRAGIAPKDYAAGYVSALKLANGRPAATTSLAMAEPFDLEKRRLQGILERPIPKLSAPWLIVLLAVIAISLPTFVGCSKPDAVKAPPTEQDAKAMAGLTSIEGPGVVISLHDSPKSTNAAPSVQTEYVVHDGDIRDIVNELWSAGAKAISVNGERIVANSSIRCIGRDIMVNFVRVSHPYVIQAVGDPRALAAHFEGDNQRVASGLFLLDMIKVKQQPHIQVLAYRPAYSPDKLVPKEMAGLTNVVAPGIIATLHDRPLPANGKPAVANDYRIHDRDIREAVNELWAAGAQAISVNDQRLVTGSSISGSLGTHSVTINSVKMTAPFVIRALGKPETLNRALTLPGGPAEGLIVLGMIDIKQQQRVEVPAYRKEKGPNSTAGPTDTTQGYPSPAKITSVHSVDTWLNFGKQLKTESWIVFPYHRRVEADDITLSYDGHDYWSFNKKTKHYSVIHYTRPYTLELDKWSTPAGIEKMWRADADVVRKNVRKELNGVEQDAIELDITSVRFSWCNQATITMFLDPKTNRVDTLVEEFRRESGEVVRSVTDHYEYNVPIDPSHFKFRPPVDAVLDSETTESSPPSVPRKAP